MILVSVLGFKAKFYWFTHYKIKISVCLHSLIESEKFRNLLHSNPEKVMIWGILTVIEWPNVSILSNLPCSVITIPGYKNAHVWKRYIVTNIALINNYFERIFRRTKMVLKVKI